MASSSKRNLLILIAVLCIVLLILLPVAFMAGQDPAATEPSTPSTTQTPTTQTPTTQVPTTIPPTTVPPTTAAPTEPPVVKTGTFTLSATGDMLIHSNVFNAPKTGSGYDFSQVFRFFADYVSNADYAVGNLETTLSGADFVHDNGDVGYSGYPQFNCPDEIISGMKNGGFDLVLTANNHTYDTRTVGLKRTLQVIIDQQLDYLGTQTGADERGVRFPLAPGAGPDPLDLLCKHADRAEGGQVQPLQPCLRPVRRLRLRHRPFPLPRSPAGHGGDAHCGD